MLQKIENFYLAILRLVVIGVAGGLLVAVVYFGFNSFGAMSPAPEEAPVAPSVSADSYKKELMGSTPNASSETQAEPVQGAIRKEYTQAVSVLDTYYEKLFETPDGVNEAILTEWIVTEGEAYPTEELRQAFASGFLARVNDLVADNDFREWCLRNGVVESLQSIFTTYKAEFDKQVEEAKAAEDERQAEHAAEKAESLQMLYVAGVAFLAFLLVVFLSIIIRIERNLRPQPQT